MVNSTKTTTRKGGKKAKKYTKYSKNFEKQVLKVIDKTQIIEKKHITGYQSMISVGQVSGNNAGYSWADITPLVGLGDNYNNRQGSRINVSGMFLRFQFWQQSSVQNNIKLKYHVVLIPNNNDNTLTNFVLQMYLSNPFNNLVDYNSVRNPDYMKSFRIIRTGYCTMPQDSTTSATQNIVKETKLGVKFKKPLVINYDKNTTSIAQSRILLIVFADNGNSSTVTTSTLSGIPTTGTNTGVIMNMAYDTYYFDG